MTVPVLVLDASARRRLLLLLLPLDDEPALPRSREVGRDGAVQLRDAGQPGPVAQSPLPHARSLSSLLLLVVPGVTFVVVLSVVVARERLSVSDAGEAHGGRNGGVRGIDLIVAVAVAVAVAVDALETRGGDGGDVLALEDASRSAHAITLSDSASAWRRSTCRLRTIGGKWEHVGTATHLGFAQGPMHGFTCAPRHAEFGCNGVPEFGLESARNISGSGPEDCRRGEVFVLPVVEFGEERRIIPIVDSRKLVALLLVPVGALLEVVLVV